MTVVFKSATRRQMPLKMVIYGAAGSGKTYTALRLAHLLGSKVFLIDTQYGSAGLYAGEIVDGKPWDFQHTVLNTYTVEWYIEAIHAAERLGANVIVIDSLSNAWDDAGGILEMVERESNQRTADGRMKGTFSAWNKGGELYKKLIRAMLASPCHLIATLRTKVDYVMETDENGRTHVRKQGTKPIQREGVDYEFDLGFSMDANNVATVTKTHSSLFPMGMTIPKPGPETAVRIREWLEAGTPDEPTPEPAETQEPEEPTVGPTKELIEEMRAYIKSALDRGVITKEQYHQWRDDHQVPPKQCLSDMDVLALHSDVREAERTGEWNPIPF